MTINNRINSINGRAHGKNDNNLSCNKMEAAADSKYIRLKRKTIDGARRYEDRKLIIIILLLLSLIIIIIIIIILLLLLLKLTT